MKRIPWYRAEPQDLADAVFSESDRVYDETQTREQRIYDACALYGDTSVFSSMAGSADIIFGDHHMSHNVIATATDALVAEVTQSTVRPMAITIGGTFDERKKAEKLTQYFEAKWDLLQVPSTFLQVVRDAVICGLGVIRVGHSNELEPKIDEPLVERVFPANFLMDDFGSTDVLPREFYIRRMVSRDQLMSLFPEQADDIENATNRYQSFWAYPDKMETHVEVIEAFHLASAPKRQDGRRVLAVRGAVLVDEKHSRYHANDTPYKIVRGVPALTGFWGEQLIMRGAPAQMELNKLLLRTQEAMHLISVPRVFVSRQSNILDAHLTNDIGIVIEHDGPPPVFHAPQSMSNEVFQHMERLEEWCFRALGVSELSATSNKPSGVNSGTALRTYSDVQTRRFINFVRSVESAYEEVARELTRVESEIAEKNPSHQVATFYKQRYDQFKWKDMELDPERFSVRIFSASALPNTPAGRLQALEEMVKTGVIDRQTFIRVAEVPDLEHVRRLVLAGDDILEEMFMKMLEEEDFYEPPDPGLDLKKAVVLATLSAYRGRLDGAPEDRIEKLFQFVDECNEMMQMAAAPVDAPMGAANEMAMVDPAMQGVPQAPGMDPTMAEEIDVASAAAAGQVTAPGGDAAPFENI